MKRYSRIIGISAVAVFVAVMILVYPALTRDKDSLYQVSTMYALLEGGYEGVSTVRAILDHGDFGIGTFDGLDGEMVVLGRKCYQVLSDGTVHEARASMLAPFAMVTFFKPGTVVPLNEPVDYDALIKVLDDAISDKAIPYAVKVEGKFGYIKVRSVPRQDRPYKPLTEALKQQVVFELRDIEGTIVGFRVPESMSGVNLAGYHFHFISKDGTAGGHLLQFSTDSATARLDGMRKFSMIFPSARQALTIPVPGNGESKKNSL